MKRMTFVNSLMVVMIFCLTNSVSADDVSDEEYRVNLMEIAKYHIYAIDQILSRKVGYLEHLESHADNLRNVSQMFPHLQPKELEKVKVDEKHYQKMIEDSESRANEFVKAARMFRKSRYGEDADQRYKEMVQVFRELQKSCWRCHNELSK
jgi:hypothetical protein